ncbi:MAG TPA: ABC transporter permease [Acidimicrobiia bacterium]|nr:ABC transporter permease [Acidimicrobiia bacterium]
MTVITALSDGAVVAKRNLLKITRLPDLLVFSTVQPIMFVLLFAYVFGSAIDVPGVSYTDYLMGGIFVQTVVFGATITGAGLADDIKKGIIDRFRSLPMARSAVLVGRTTSDLLNNALVVAIMAVTGLIVGWGIHTSFWEAAGGFALLLMFSYAISWMMATVGLSVSSVEVVQNASFLVIFPLTFISNAFVPITNFPPVLKTFAEWNPVSAVAQAVRELFGNTSPLFPPPDVWPLQNAVLASSIWIVIFLVVFVPLAVSRFKKSAAR